MDKYAVRNVVAQLLACVAMFSGLGLAQNAVNRITAAINALADSDYIAGSSEQFANNLLSLVIGGAIFGMGLATLLALVIISAKNASDNRPRQPLRNR